MNEIQAIGVGVTGCGVLIFLIGILTLLNREFLVTADILLLIGLNMIYGIKEFIQFLFKKEKLVGTIAFILGIVIVFIKLPIPGIICQIVGAYWLFGGFLPLLLSIIGKIPIVSMFVPSAFKDKDQLDV